MLALHSVLSNSIIMYLLLIGLWGLVGYFRGFGLSPNYRGALVIGEVVLLVQAVLGVTLLLMGGAPRDGLHFLYGVAAFLGLPLAYSYVRGRDPRSALLVYSLTALFVFGLALRATITAL